LLGMLYDKLDSSPGLVSDCTFRPGGIVSMPALKVGG